ncbi:MAG: ABC transporter substrate binding protein [Aliarcobacter sp.]|nr:ABC transporter substrate binding protein [Aliarcobacter sp.]
MKFLILFFLTITIIFANSSKEILLLHSYNNGLKWTDGITQGVKEILDKHPEFELTIEYMDSKKIDSQEYFDILMNLYEKKFSNRKYLVVIAADNYAYEFVLKNHKKLFYESSVVFTGVENFDKDFIPLELKKYVTGVVEYKKIKENIELIKKTITDLNTLYIISDDTFSSLAIKKQILDDVKSFEKDIKIVFDNEIDINTISNKINSLPKNSAVLFTSLYKDINGKYITSSQLREFFNSSKYPIFAINKIHLGEGVIGGVMVNAIEQGNLAAKKTLEIIQGKDAFLIPISIPTSKYYFDYEVLEKFNLNNSKIPILSTMLNEPKSFFEKNRQFIDGTYFLLPVLFLLIIGLIVNITKRINLEIKLLEQNKLDNVLLNNIKSIIYWKSNDGTLLGCNEALCLLLDMKKEEIIGKKVEDIFHSLCDEMKDSDKFINELETTLTFKNISMEVLVRRKKYFNKKNQEAGIVTIINDMTDIKKLQEQRKKDEQFIIQRSKLSEIGEIMTSIAHQWKTPLIEISTIAQELLYKRSKKELSKEDSKEFVDEIMTQVQYMTKTIDDFRSFIKPSMSKSDFEIREAIEELLRIIEHNIKYNYIDVEVNFKENKNYEISGYPNEFKQAILSIINNSRDSILKRREKESFQGQIKIDIFEKDNDIYISIKDNGVGIKTENLEKIFEPFFTDKVNGDGFGLYMVKLIIEDKMDGIIKAVEQDVGANILISIKKDGNVI